MNVNTVHTGDCLDVLNTLPANAVHAVVTDPPYGLAFMGRSWDDFEPKEYQAWCQEWAAAVQRVLKPGGHLLAFSGNRTHHRLFSGVEDAGFEIRDTVTWHYGSGFPKALDVSKAIDKQADEEREVVGEKTTGRHKHGFSDDAKKAMGEEAHKEKGGFVSNPSEITAPATDAAKKWDGFKTALKPATEYVVVARKPLSEGTVAENVCEHGTGALNIDGTRVENNDDGGFWPGGDDEIPDDDLYGDSRTGGEQHTEGRYPSNVVFDELEAERLDRDVGELGGGDLTKNEDVNESGDVDLHEGYQRPNSTMYGGGGPDDAVRSYGDSGGPSRYFYTSKATKAERTLDGRIDNAHPTVKPLDLMSWLVTLVTAEGQTVLDPFCGSGTTLKAAKEAGREFVGIEQQPQWADVARVRAGLTPRDPAHVRESDAQQGLEVFEDD